MGSRLAKGGINFGRSCNFSKLLTDFEYQEDTAKNILRETSCYLRATSCNYFAFTYFAVIGITRQNDTRSNDRVGRVVELAFRFTLRLFNLKQLD
ncbi:MAG: hypothetical protein QME25_01785 [Bacteroidota bacterium]|nr:hypothetical protein [Bacteroidota bacterium]